MLSVTKLCLRLWPSGLPVAARFARLGSLCARVFRMPRHFVCVQPKQTDVELRETSVRFSFSSKLALLHETAGLLSEYLSFGHSNFKVYTKKKKTCNELEARNLSVLSRQWSHTSLILNGCVGLHCLKLTGNEPPMYEEQERAIRKHRERKQAWNTWKHSKKRRALWLWIEQR